MHPPSAHLLGASMWAHCPGKEVSRLTTLTVGPVLASAADAVSQFDGLVTLVVGLALGFFVVGWIISKAKGAVH